MPHPALEAQAWGLLRLLLLCDPSLGRTKGNEPAQRYVNRLRVGEVGLQVRGEMHGLSQRADVDHLLEVFRSTILQAGPRLMMRTARCAIILVSLRDVWWP